MDIYASDDEKAEEIKRWWRENGRSVIIGSILGVAVIFGGRYWLDYQRSLAENASLNYQHLTALIAEGNQVEAENKTQTLFGEFSSTPYAVFAAFEMAASSMANHDIAAAQTYLQWVIDNAELAGHVEIARLRLAQLLVNDKNYEQALVIIDQSQLESFESLFAELRGDIYAVMDKMADARAAYQKAILTLSQGEPRELLLQMKIDDLAVTNDG